MKTVGAAFYLHVYRGATGEPLLGVGAGSDNANGLDSVEARHVRGNVRQPNVIRERAVDSDVV